MNREIKFRAWIPELGEMLYSEKEHGDNYEVWHVGLSVWVEYQETIHREQGGEHIESIEYVKPYQIVMQFTGLKDKNGKEIYEGDVLKFTHKSGTTSKYNYKVHFENGSFWLSYFDGEEDYRWGAMWQIFKHKLRIEVIGNIHDNPELI